MKRIEVYTLPDIEQPIGVRVSATHDYQGFHMSGDQALSLARLLELAAWKAVGHITMEDDVGEISIGVVGDDQYDATIYLEPKS